MRREHKFTMMFSDDEWTKLCELAGAQGMSLSTFLRRPLYLESSPAPLARAVVDALEHRFAQEKPRKQNGAKR